MRWITMIRLRLRSLLRRGRVDDEIDEELRYHVERQIDELTARRRERFRRGAPHASRIDAMQALRCE